MIVTIKRGLADPTTTNLSPFQIGWGRNNKRLFINNDGEMVRLNPKVTLNGAINDDPGFYAPLTLTANRVVKTKSSWGVGTDPFEFISIDGTVTASSGNLITSGAVSTAITSLQSTINSALNNKLDKLTGTSTLPRVYASLPNGNQSSFRVDNVATGSTLALRDSSGRVSTANAGASAHAIPLGQADDRYAVKSVEETKQDKLVAGDNITIDENTNVISASGGGLDLDELGYMNHASDIYYRARQQSLFSNAWEHSATVDPLEISVDSNYENPRGSAQYPNGATEGVIIPYGVQTIGESAFDGFDINQPLVIPNSVTSIGDYAFYAWRSNNYPLVIPNSVTSIGEYAFQSWSSNNQPLVISNSVTSIGQYAFKDWRGNNQPLVIPNSVTSIGVGSFHNWSSNNQPLVIPNSVTSIGNNAFKDWRGNNQPLVIPNSVTSIGVGSFSDWSSNTHPLVIPSSVTSIGPTAFLNWSLVPYVEMKSETPPTLMLTTAFNNQNNAPIYVPDGSVEAYKTASNWSSYADRIFPVSDKDKIPEVPPVSNSPKPIYQSVVNSIGQPGTYYLFNGIDVLMNPNGMSEFDQSDTTYRRVKEVTFILKEEETEDMENPSMQLFAGFKRVQSITIPLFIQYYDSGMMGVPPMEQIDLSLFYPIVFKKLDGTDVTIKVTTLSGDMLYGPDDSAFGSLQVEVTNVNGWTEELPAGSPMQLLEVAIKYESKY